MRLKISIVIPCYNVEEYISQCLDSVVNQTYENIEIICINDGSTDNTLTILKNFVQRDHRMILLDQTNKGLSLARNVGLEKCTGDFVMFLDSDDYLSLQTLSEVSAYLNKRELICFSYNRVYNDDINPRKLNLHGEYNADYIQRRMVGLCNEELSDPSQMDSLVTVCMKLYVADIIKKNNILFTDTSLIGTEDLLFNLQYLEFAKNVEVIDLPFYFYRKTNASSLTSIYKENLFEKWKVLYSIIDEIIKCKNIEFKLALENRICLSIIGLGLNETFSGKSNTAKKQQLLKILSDPLYEQAYSTLSLKNFPLHWKLFFYFAKNKMTIPLLWMLQIIKLKISK